MARIWCTPLVAAFGRGTLGGFPTAEASNCKFQFLIELCMLRIVQWPPIFLPIPIPRLSVRLSPNQFRSGHTPICEYRHALKRFSFGRIVEKVGIGNKPL